jgi:lysophospholipase L1-like esterase
MYKSNRKQIIISYLFIGLVIFFCIGILGYKVYKLEDELKIERTLRNTAVNKLSDEIETQKATIESLNSLVDELNNDILQKELDATTIVWSDGEYDYLAIGNSITLHGLASYWWDDDRGMASSSDEKDYVHLVTSYLEQKNNLGGVVENSVNLSSWETNSSDRAEFLALLDDYLSTSLELVTIQLGENVSDFSTYETDFEDLINYVKDKAPNAEIIVVGDFWNNENRDLLKEEAANNCSVTYVSLEGIKDNSEYYAGKGTLVEDSDGQMHTIEHDGVAMHPSDKGMEAIAERIIDSLNE